MNMKQIDKILGDTSVKLPGAKISIDEGIDRILNIIDAEIHANKIKKLDDRKQYLASLKVERPTILVAASYEVQKNVKLVKPPRKGTAAEKVYNIVVKYSTIKTRKYMLTKIHEAIGGTKNNANVNLGYELKRYNAIRQQLKA
jgi:hypothetical protein